MSEGRVLDRWPWLRPALAGAAAAILVVLLLRLLVDDDASADPLPRTPASSDGTGAAATPSNPPSASPTRTVEDARSKLHLEGGGLAMVGFGDSQLNVVRTLTDVLGPPDEVSDQPCESYPEAQMHWERWADLSVVFDAGRFVGYLEGVHFPPGSPALELGTDRGLSPGDPLDRAEELYGDLRVRRVDEQGSSGVFRFRDPVGQGPLFGVVEGEEQTVITIYAGDLC